VDTKRAIIAKCSECLRPFVAGWAGNREIALGVGGGSMYVDELNLHGPGVVEMTGVQHSCPFCGGVGDVPDGIYAFVEQGYSLLRDLSPDQARALVAALRRYVRDEATEEEVSEAAPAAARPFIRSTLKRYDPKFWIPILLTLVLFVAQQRASSQQATRIEEVVRDAIARSDEHALVAERQMAALREQIDRIVDGRRSGTPRAKPTATNLSPPEQLPNKNDPCWCGSGRKFARCHRQASLD
jgi:hypothetical protein